MLGMFWFLSRLMSLTYDYVSSQLLGEKVSPMKGLMLNRKEQSRVETLNRALAGKLPVDKAAIVLGVSERYAWRMSAAYRREGAGISCWDSQLVIT